MDIYLATLQISKSPIMTLSSVADEFLLYTTQIPKISIVLFNILKNSWKLNPYMQLGLFLCLEVNITCYSLSNLPTVHTHKALFTCVVYNYILTVAII